MFTTRTEHLPKSDILRRIFGEISANLRRIQVSRISVENLRKLSGYVLFENCSSYVYLHERMQKHIKIVCDIIQNHYCLIRMYVLLAFPFTGVHHDEVQQSDFTLRKCECVCVYVFVHVHTHKLTPCKRNLLIYSALQYVTGL